MDRASSLSYPGSKTLAGWWRQLQARQPHVLQVGYRFVHRIEASVQVRQPQALDPFEHLIAQAVALEPQGVATLDAVHQRLRIAPPLLRQIFNRWTEQGLLSSAGVSAWRLTDLGRTAVTCGSYPVQRRNRLMLSFAEQLDATGQRLGPPLFLPLGPAVGTAWQVDEAHRFEPAFLQHAVAQPLEWKQQWRFPSEIETIEGSGANWQEVVIDRPERLLLVLACVADQWQAYAVKADGWQLNEQTPILHLPGSLNPATLGFAATPTNEALRDAWGGWCRERNLPANEVELCKVAYQPPRLVVEAPERLMQRLRAAKSDLFKGESWLLVGDGFMRTAVVLSIA